MGLFDKLKNAALNAAENFKDGYDEARAMDIYALCDELWNLPKLDSKAVGYSAALREKCEAMTDEDIEEFYGYTKEAGTFLKNHPARDIVEDVLVERKMYIKDKNGNLTRNGLFKFNK